MTPLKDSMTQSDLESICDVAAGEAIKSLKLPSTIKNLMYISDAIMGAIITREL